MKFGPRRRANATEPLRMTPAGWQPGRPLDRVSPLSVALHALSFTRMRRGLDCPAPSSGSSWFSSSRRTPPIDSRPDAWSWSSSTPASSRPGSGWSWIAVSRPCAPAIPVSTATSPVTTEPVVLMRVFSGIVGLREARSSGSIEVAGQPRSAAPVSHWSGCAGLGRAPCRAIRPQRASCTPVVTDS